MQFKLSSGASQGLGEVLAISASWLPFLVIFRMIVRNHVSVIMEKLAVLAVQMGLVGVLRTKGDRVEQRRSKGLCKVLDEMLDVCNNEQS